MTRFFLLRAAGPRVVAAALWSGFAAAGGFGQQPPAPISPPATGFIPAPSAPGAPGPCRITLDEARQRALTLNPNLVLARLNVDEKGHARAAAGKDYFPKVLGSETYFRFDKDLGSVVSLRTGQLGVLPVGVQTVNVAVLNQNTSLTTLLVAQPITKLIAVHALHQIARADEAAARFKLDKGQRDVVSGVTQAYYGLLGAQRILAALEFDIRAVGEVAKARPGPEIQVSLVELRQGAAQARGQVQEITDQLNALLDLPPGTALELVDPVPPPPPVRSADEAAQVAVTVSPEVREAEQNILKAEAGLKVAKMDYIPDVSIVGGYGNQTGSNAIQPNFGYLGITASYTFWDWGKRGDVRRQRQSQIALAHQNVRVTRDKVVAEARKAFGAYEQAAEAYRLAEEMVQARRGVEKGAAGPAAIVAAKRETVNAELELMKAEIAYRVAHAQLMAAVGG